MDQEPRIFSISTTSIFMLCANKTFNDSNYEILLLLYYSQHVIFAEKKDY
jgi:hypothetical protein